MAAITITEFDSNGNPTSVESAVTFSVRYSNKYMPLQFRDKDQAEEVCRALLRVHAEGKEAAKTELRQWLGVKHG